MQTCPERIRPSEPENLSPRYTCYTFFIMLSNNNAANVTDHIFKQLYAWRIGHLPLCGNIGVASLT